MAIIHILPPQISNQIAAGEVVERPASIVKELVENSLDAGATSVSVSLVDGGLSSIHIVDNGCGIDNAEVSKAFLRHATSKISKAEDLDAIQSLGFRGEALSSIGAVALVTMITRQEEAALGTKLVFDNGTMISQQAYGCVSGTSIKVENLFAKVPARLKFMRSPRTEAAYCADFISRMILCRPDISFRFIHNDKTVYETFGDGKLKNAISALYGNEIVPKLRQVSFDNGYMKIKGYIGTQEISRPNRTMESLFVNGRYIKSTALCNAIERAYDTRMMNGRYPFAVLNLTLSPREVDVNVHPAKTQIRFADEDRIAYGFTAACSQALRQAVTPKAVLPLSKAIAQKEQNSQTDAVNKATYQCSISQGSTPHAERYSVKIPDKEARRENAYRFNSFEQNITVTNPLPIYQHDKKNKAIPDEVQQVNLAIEQPYSVLGCAFQSYWIIEQGDELYLIDQHAACERKNYEAYLRRLPYQVSQQLLVPEKISLLPREMSQALAYKTELEELGYRFDKAGETSIRIHAVPVLNGKLFETQYFHDALNAIGEVGSLAVKELVKAKLISAACKHAIKAGDRIQEHELHALLKEYLKEEIPLTCPHGRPVMVRLSKRDIEKDFKRIL